MHTTMRREVFHLWSVRDQHELCKAGQTVTCSPSDLLHPQLFLSMESGVDCWY